MASHTTGQGNSTTSHQSGGNRAAEALDDAQATLHKAVDYVRDTDADEMGRDVMRTAKTHPVTSLLVLGAVVIGGGMLVAAMLQEDGEAQALGRSRGPNRLASALSGLGPRGGETLSRIRDAAFSLAFEKAIDQAELMFPGFREHYDRR